MPLNLTRLTLVLYSILLFTPCENYFVHVSQKEGHVYFPGEFIIAAKYGLFVEIALIVRSDNSFLGLDNLSTGCTPNLQGGFSNKKYISKYMKISKINDIL